MNDPYYDRVVKITFTCKCGRENFEVDESTTIHTCSKCSRKYQVQAEVHVYRV